MIQEHMLVCENSSAFLCFLSFSELTTTTSLCSTNEIVFVMKSRWIVYEAEAEYLYYNNKLKHVKHINIY
jgi:hypothetical protein